MKLDLILFILSSVLLGACSIPHPCRDGGDTAFGPTIIGNRHCIQRKNRDGHFQNEGHYIQWHPNGKTAVEGVFKNGKKDGFWNRYDDTGKKVQEVFFIDGVETPRDGSKSTENLPEKVDKK